MSKVPQIPPFKPSQPTSKMIVCTTDGKPLPPEDVKALEEYMEYRIKRAKRQRPHPNTKGE